jgi:ABC-type transport system involved in multi-copper enzyme maturation permease subunit
MIILLMVSYGTFAISKEIETRTMGFLLSQPISRMKLYLSRYIAGVIGLIFFILMSETITWPLVRLFGDSVYWSDIFKVGLLGFMLGLFVLGLTMMISSFTSESSKTTTYAGGILIIMYVLFLISSLESKLRNLKYLSLFHYYDPANIIGSDRIGSSVIISLLVFSLVTCVIGLLRFVNRDVAV